MNLLYFDLYCVNLIFVGLNHFVLNQSRCRLRQIAIRNFYTSGYCWWANTCTTKTIYEKSTDHEIFFSHGAPCFSCFHKCFYPSVLWTPWNWTWSSRNNFIEKARSLFTTVKHFASWKRGTYSTILKEEEQGQQILSLSLHIYIYMYICTHIILCLYCMPFSLWKKNLVSLSLEQHKQKCHQLQGSNPPHITPLLLKGFEFSQDLVSSLISGLATIGIWAARWDADGWLIFVGLLLVGKESLHPGKLTWNLKVGAPGRGDSY